VYEVREVFATAPDDLEVLRNTDEPRLTLITCDAWSYETNTYQERLIVVAVPIGTMDEGEEGINLSSASQ
jgi:sortase (surface protein transpeptidase)